MFDLDLRRLMSLITGTFAHSMISGHDLILARPKYEIPQTAFVYFLVFICFKTFAGTRIYEDAYVPEIPIKFFYNHINIIHTF